MKNTNGDLVGEIREVFPDGRVIYLLYGSIRIVQEGTFDDLKARYKLVLRTV